jgi:hypothetical protein
MRFLFLIGLFLPIMAAAQMTGVAPHQGGAFGLLHHL